MSRPRLVLVTLCCALVLGATRAGAEEGCAQVLQRVCCGDENLIIASGCLPTQQVPLVLAAGEHEVFVDGEPLRPVPEVLSLRSDRDHTVFIKRRGYKPALIVLRSDRLTGSSGEPSLTPDRIELELARQIEIDTLGVDIADVEESGSLPAPPANQPDPEPSASSN